MFHHQIAAVRLTRILIAAAAVLIIASHVTTGLSGDEKPKAPAEKIETFPLEISVSDQDGVGIPVSRFDRMPCERARKPEPITSGSRTNTARPRITRQMRMES